MRPQKGVSKITSTDAGKMRWWMGGATEGRVLVPYLFWEFRDYRKPKSKLLCFPFSPYNFYDPFKQSWQAEKGFERCTKNQGDRWWKEYLTMWCNKQRRRRHITEVQRMKGGGAQLPDAYSQIWRLYVLCPSGLNVYGSATLGFKIWSLPFLG